MMAFLLQDMADVYIGAQTALGFPTIILVVMVPKMDA